MTVVTEVTVVTVVKVVIVVTVVTKKKFPPKTRSQKNLFSWFLTKTTFCQQKLFSPKNSKNQTVTKLKKSNCDET